MVDSLQYLYATRRNSPPPVLTCNTLPIKRLEAIVSYLYWASLLCNCKTGVKMRAVLMALKTESCARVQWKSRFKLSILVRDDKFATAFNEFAYICNHSEEFLYFAIIL